MNKCDLTKKGISILLSVETPRSEIMSLYADHLKECENCLNFLEKGVADYKIIDEPDEKLIGEARLKLRENLYKFKLKKQVSIFSSILRLIKGPVVKYVFVPVCTLLIGILIGRWIYDVPDISVSNIPMKTEKLVSKGDFAIKKLLVSVDKDEATVDLNFELAKEMNISGDVNNSEILNFLTYAVKNPVSSGTKFKCLDLLAGRKEEEVKDALIFASTYDKNPGIRLEAVKSLKNFKIDNELKNSYLEIFRKEKNPAIKIEVLDALKETDDPLIFAFLEESYLKEKNRYIKFKIKGILETQRKKDRISENEN